LIFAHIPIQHAGVKKHICIPKPFVLDKLLIRKLIIFINTGLIIALGVHAVSITAAAKQLVGLAARIVTIEGEEIFQFV